jgi:group II intron reverse transcriptase/maturase
MAGTQSPVDITPKLQRIAELSRTIGDAALTTLAHHIDLNFLYEAYRRTRKGGAVGIDGQTAADFATDLEGNLRALLDALKSGQYRAPPVRRVYIPKADGRRRPLGIPTFSDKVLQQAVSMVLTAVYEPHFHAHSYGFRPRRSAHQALDTLRQALREMGGGWVIDADIQGYFDNLDHRQLRVVLEQRVRDGVIVRAVGKWLHAGVMEDGALHATDAGTPQGGVISPILANIYLDEVLDRWFEEQVRPRLRGRALLVRYADDFVLVFEQEADARRVMDVLPKRFARFGLTLHPEKTRLLDFRHPWRKAGDPDGPPGHREPRSFDLLGFRHHWQRTRKGGYAVRQRTAGKRLSRALQSINQWCRDNRHRPIAEQHRELLAKLRGHYGYYNRIGNRHALEAFRHSLLATWRRWLNRRSQRARLWWHRFLRLLERYPLPFPPVLATPA